MGNFQTLFVILIPLVIGFFVVLPRQYLRYVNQTLNALVYLILGLIGLSLSQVDNLLVQMRSIGLSVSVLFAILIILNLSMLIALDKYHPWQYTKKTASISQSVSFLGSVKQIGCVIVGFMMGMILPKDWIPSQMMSTYALVLLIFLVGIQLRSSGITLRQVLINRRGILVSGIFMISCLLSGIVFSILFAEVSLSKGLALSSGYGWYSLSSIVMNKAYGPVWGSVALLNDLMREIFALIFIPMLMRNYPSAAVAIGGATSMDFTLPVIQSSGGIEVVPLAISFGFIVNIVSPILMVIFSNMNF